tara:strand:- start:188 stop:316 length:129 start_codon:yes stop_codon:yes gene_type:complete
MIDKILFDLFLLVLIIIGLSCALIPLYIGMNDKINDKFKDEL